MHCNQFYTEKQKCKTVYWLNTVCIVNENKNTVEMIEMFMVQFIRFSRWLETFYTYDTHPHRVLVIDQADASLTF